MKCRLQNVMNENKKKQEVYRC